jgi:XTP/dITP diphosphohydrolase
MKTIVLASNNGGKLREFAQLLAPYRATLFPQAKFIAAGADETGATFIENALLKARHAAQAAGLPAIADDSGLEVAALHGAPGVYSARFAGEHASDDDNNRKLLIELAAVPLAQRTARFRCVLVYVRAADDPEPIVAEGVWEGRILDHSRGINGFGYDSLFLPSGSSLSAAELTSDTKNQLSHRGQALRALLALLIAHREIKADVWPNV